MLAEGRAAFSIYLQSKAENERFLVGFLIVAVSKNDNKSKHFSWTISYSVVFPLFLLDI